MLVLACVGGIARAEDDQLLIDLTSQVVMVILMFETLRLHIGLGLIAPVAIRLLASVGSCDMYSLNHPWLVLLLLSDVGLADAAQNALWTLSLHVRILQRVDIIQVR